MRAISKTFHGSPALQLAVIVGITFLGTLLAFSFSFNQTHAVGNPSCVGPVGPEPLEFAPAIASPDPADTSVTITIGGIMSGDRDECVDPETSGCFNIVALLGTSIVGDSAVILPGSDAFEGQTIPTTVELGESGLCQQFPPVIIDIGSQSTFNGSQVFDTSSLAEGQYTLNIRADDNAGNFDTIPVVFTVDHPDPAPTVSLTASPSTIEEGQSSTLTWVVTDATSCTASGDWSGSKATGGGSEAVSPAEGSYTYTLDCSGPGGSAQDSAQLTVTAPGGGEEGECSFDANLVAEPSSAQVGQSVALKASVSNWDNCSTGGTNRLFEIDAEGDGTYEHNSGWTGCYEPGDSCNDKTIEWAVYDPAATYNAVARISWRNNPPPDGTETVVETDTAQVVVSDGGGTLPSVDIKARDLTAPPVQPAPFEDGPITVDSGDDAELQWVVSDADSCTASTIPHCGPTCGWHDTDADQGNGTHTKTLNNRTNSREYVIDCSNAIGSVQDSVVINVASSGTVVVNSNEDTTWSLAGPLGIITQGTPSSSETYTDQAVGTYTLTPATLPGFDAPVITPASSQNLSSGGTITFTVTYTASGPSGSLDVDLTANGSDGPLSVDDSTKVIMGWTIEDGTAVSCSASGGDSNPPAWDSLSPDPAGGSSDRGTLAEGNYSYSITCQDSGGKEDTDTVDVTVSSIVSQPECSDGIDNADVEDTIADYPNDPGCVDPNDDDERDAPAQCDNNIDDDDDGKIDYPDDPGCVDEDDVDETDTACSDGLDNDGDGLIDHESVTPVGETADDGCESVSDNDERGDPDVIEF